MQKDNPLLSDIRNAGQKFQSKDKSKWIDPRDTYLKNRKSNSKNDLRAPLVNALIKRRNDMGEDDD